MSEVIYEVQNVETSGSRKPCRCSYQIFELIPVCSTRTVQKQGCNINYTRIILFLQLADYLIIQMQH